MTVEGTFIGNKPRKKGRVSTFLGFEQSAQRLAKRLRAMYMCECVHIRMK